MSSPPISSGGPSQPGFHPAKGGRREGQPGNDQAATASDAWPGPDKLHRLLAHQIRRLKDKLKRRDKILLGVALTSRSRKHKCEKLSQENARLEAQLRRHGDLVKSCFECSICHELLARATTTLCGHTFCRPCLREWAAKSPECPYCRAPLRFQAPSVVVNDYVDKAAGQLFPGAEKRVRQGGRREEQERRPIRKVFDLD